jgi:hypothetical protein
MTIKRNLFWDATPYSLAEFYRCFGRTYPPYLEFFLVSWSGVRLSPLGTWPTNWSIVPAPGGRLWWAWSSRWNENWQGKPKYSVNSPVPGQRPNPKLKDWRYDNMVPDLRYRIDQGLLMDECSRMVPCSRRIAKKIRKSTCSNTASSNMKSPRIEPGRMIKKTLQIWIFRSLSYKTSYTCCFVRM